MSPKIFAYLHIQRYSIQQGAIRLSKVPRAGKLFCSAKCKQFYHYHKAEMKGIERAEKGIADNNVELRLADYNAFSLIVKSLNEYRVLYRRKHSTYPYFTEEDNDRYKELKQHLPESLRQMNLPDLSLERWSFIRVRYPTLSGNQFLNLVDSLGHSFFNRLDETPATKKNEKTNPIVTLFESHLFKIASGKIRFM